LGGNLPHPRRRGRRLHGHQVMDAVGDRRGVDHRVARPGSDRVEIEEPAVDDAVKNAVIDAFVRTEARGLERVQLMSRGAQPRDLGCDGGGREIFQLPVVDMDAVAGREDRKSTRLNSSYGSISYAVFCLKKKNNNIRRLNPTPSQPPKRRGYTLRRIFAREPRGFAAESL